MLLIHNLTKTYSNGVRALRGVSLEIPPGMFGLVGPNVSRQIHVDENSGHAA